MVRTGDTIEEVQGLYGPFTLSERVLQKLWLRGELQTEGLRTASGRSLKIRDPGRWNLQEGPDFKEAQLEIDGRTVVGDVEVHFRVADWWAHGHEGDRNYADVVLHVVLYPERHSGCLAEIPGETLFLMPCLEHDLEHYANEEALRELERVDALEWVAELLERPAAERVAALWTAAEDRWTAKLAYAVKRLERGGWMESCHQACLEGLGYARNRGSFSRLALKWPLARWYEQRPDPDHLFEAFRSEWRLAGVRPLNHPRARLRQYSNVVAHDPDWPERLRDALGALEPPSELDATARLRRCVALPNWQQRVRATVFAGQLGERRFHTLMADAFLPLAAAGGHPGARTLWMHWPPGDLPEALDRFLKLAGITGRSRPRANGLAQGALELFFRA